MLLAQGGCHSNLRFFTRGSVIGGESISLRAFAVNGRFLYSPAFVDACFVIPRSPKMPGPSQIRPDIPDFPVDVPTGQTLIGISTQKPAPTAGDHRSRRLGGTVGTIRVLIWWLCVNQGNPPRDEQKSGGGKPKTA